MASGKLRRASANATNGESGRSLALRHLETAARFLKVNLLPLPLIALGFAVLMHLWHPILPLAVWAVATIGAWSVSIAVFNAFLRDPRRAEHEPQWTILVCSVLFLSTTAFASIAVLFWVDGDRLNNVLLYTLLGVGMVSGAAQSAPNRLVCAANIAPYAIFFLYSSQVHEATPVRYGIGFLQICFLGLVVSYARIGWKMTRDTLLLRDERRDLIGRLEAALEMSTMERERAERASRIKSEFLANMSHELRTPLNAILGFSDMLETDTFAGKRAEYARLIHRSGSHLLALINDILDLAKIESGHLRLAESLFDVRLLMRDCVELMGARAQEGGIALSLKVDKAVPLLQADERAIRQILLNLSGNAIKFTPAGGQVVIFARLGVGGELLFGVRDNGVGIAPDDLAEVFESFGQGRHDAVTHDKGTGLGLSIVRGLAEAHGGRAEIESAVGKGTCVTVTFPAWRLRGQEKTALIA